MRFEARKRTAIDGRVWWCVYDTTERKWSTYLCFGRYKTKRAAQADINHFSRVWQIA